MKKYTAWLIMFVFAGRAVTEFRTLVLLFLLYLYLLVSWSRLIPIHCADAKRQRSKSVKQLDHEWAFFFCHRSWLGRDKAIVESVCCYIATVMWRCISCTLSMPWEESWLICHLKSVDSITYFLLLLPPFVEIS